MRLTRYGSLKTRIAVVAALLFLGGIGIISLIVSHLLQDEMQRMLTGRQLDATQHIGREISGKLTLRLESLQRVGSNIPGHLLADPAALQTWLEDRRAIHLLFPTGLMIVPADGGPTLAEVPRLETRPKSFTDRDWFIRASQSTEPVVSQPLIARATGEPSLVMAVPIRDAEQRLLAIVAGVTPLAAPGFLSHILDSRPSPLGSYQLIAPQARLFALTSDRAQASRPLPPRGEDPLLDAAIEGESGIRIITNRAGEAELAAIVDVPPAGWRLLARQPAHEALAPVHNTLTNTWLATALLSFPIVGLLLLALRRLLQPLGELADDLRGMADGTRPMHPITVHNDDEVAQVSQSFNQLQQKLLAQEERLAHLAQHDPLTQLPNRRAINERIEHELLRAQRQQTGLALLFLDLDGFKPVNDTYGHAIGDQLLIEIAHRLRACIRDCDLIARLGGDEFLLCLTDCEAPLLAGERVATDCIAAIGGSTRVGDHIMVKIGVSIGVALLNPGDEATLSTSELLRQADAAMYRAKANGRNRYVIYSPEITSLDDV